MSSYMGPGPVPGTLGVMGAPAAGSFADAPAPVVSMGGTTPPGTVLAPGNASAKGTPTISAPLVPTPGKVEAAASSTEPASSAEPTVPTSSEPAESGESASAEQASEQQAADEPTANSNEPASNDSTSNETISSQPTATAER